MDEFSDGANTAYFTFDADKRRIWAKRNGTEEKYVLSGNDVVADYDGNDSLVATYDTPGLDSNLTKKIGENVYFYVRDGLGSIRKILDSDETAQNTYDYKAFGAVYGTPTENIANRYRFTSRRWDSESLLHYYRARLYDQEIGRFLGKDPAKRSMFRNKCLYSANNPPLFRDPLGLFTVLFRGFLNLPFPYNDSISSNIVEKAGKILNDHGEIAMVYNFEQFWDAFFDVKNYFLVGNRDECEELNIVGFSCGCGPAFNLVQTVSSFALLKNVKIKNLIYADFNWGAMHYPPCKNNFSWTGDFTVLNNIDNKIHIVSTGPMTEGAREAYPTIVSHTQDLWEHCPLSTWYESVVEYLKGEFMIEKDTVKPEIYMKYVLWALVNTSGFVNVSQPGITWPHMERWEFGGDHLQLGGQSVRYPQRIADQILKK